MSRTWRIALAVVAMLVAVNLLLRFLGTITGGTPGGPRSSSYATSRGGAAAFAELLGRAGHSIEQVRTLPHATPPSSGATVFLLDPPSVAPRDADALRAFVARGGRLVVGGLSGESLRLLVPQPPRLVRGSPLARVHGLDGTLRIRTDGAAWRTAAGPVFVVVRRLGTGAIYALADASPLQNRLLASADNASLGLELAGAPSRPAEFLESYHGYGRSSGLSALPLAWKLLLGGLALAGLVWMVARGRRFGPPEQAGRQLPPPRREYVDSLAAVVARTKQRDAAVEPVRQEARRAVVRRASLPPDAGDEDVRAAARRLGLPDEDSDALLTPARTDADVLAVGRAFARIREDRG